MIETIPLNLDVAVKIAQICLPIVLVAIGAWISISVNKYSHTIKVASDFNTKWSDEFILKCRLFNESVSDIHILIFGIANAGVVAKDKETEFNHVVEGISRQKYDIEIYSDLIDHSEDVTRIVTVIFDEASANVKAVKQGGRVDFESIKLMQRKLNKALKEMQKSVLEL